MEETMSLMNRRDVTRLLGATALFSASPAGLRAVYGQARPKVVVIGGGAGGATAARYIAKDSAGAIDVVLIEPSRKYYTCFFSNLYVGGFRDFESLGHTYERLASEYDINVVHDMATDIDRDARQVVLASGERVPYDRLVVSPGIDLKYESVPGYSLAASSAMPHAWKSGTQVSLLRHKVSTMREGGTFVMIAPANPYRCPPGPYERVSMVAHVLKQSNPTAKIIVLDAKENFSKQGLFMEGWETHYPGMVEWLPATIHGGIKMVDAAAGTIETDLDTFKADVANVIPNQMAGHIAQVAGLTNDTGYCPIMPDSMKSAVDENIFVLGDATIAGDMPKSGFSANSQAKVAAMVIRGELTGSRVFPARYSNTCWSLLDTDDGVKIGASYEPTPEKIAATSTFVSQTGESAELRRQTYLESIDWYEGITSDMLS
jgi:sulfide dehydrogenase [flavocytochrome c] flavoprotein subunit